MLQNYKYQPYMFTYMRRSTGTGIILLSLLNDYCSSRKNKKKFTAAGGAGGGVPRQTSW